jgi:glycosyltransferase involved in cell wall biosynthesis
MPEGSEGRSRFNWFSPLPPARTAIAEYTELILSALSREADLVAWTDQPTWSTGIESYATVRQWQGHDWSALNSADATVYHIGNNALFHGWIWEVARRHPGIVVLHDARLHELFAGYLLHVRHDVGAYIDAVWRCHGDAAVDAELLVRGEMSADVLGEELPMTELAVERARGAVVHTATAAKEVAALGRCSVLQLDFPYAPGSPPPARAWDGVLRLVMFGYLGGNRRIDAMLEAIALFPDRHRLRLDLIGEAPEPQILKDRIAALGLADIVKMWGYMQPSEIDTILDRSHLALNLRYPTKGEASSAQLRIWSRGLASVVTRTGWYAELPEGTAGFVDPDDEVADLHRHFTRALADPGWLQAMGLAGRREVERRHDPTLYATALVEGIAQMMRTPVSILSEEATAVARVMSASGFNAAAKTALSRRAAEELCRWTHGRYPGR